MGLPGYIFQPWMRWGRFPVCYNIFRHLEEVNAEGKYETAPLLKKKKSNGASFKDRFLLVN